MRPALRYAAAQSQSPPLPPAPSQESHEKGSLTARSQERKRKLAERSHARRLAAHLVVPLKADLVVCGGGAAGLTGAIAAARQGLKVVILEAQEIAGAPILATGNGRCNLANKDLDSAHYNAPAFVKKVMGAHPLNAILEFFSELGLEVVAEDNRLYPQSHQAASVRNLLLAELDRLGVCVAPLREVADVRAKQGNSLFTWEVHYQDRAHPPRTGTSELEPPGTIDAQAVLLAMGGGALDALQTLRLSCTPLCPGLCGLSCTPSPLGQLNGRKVEGALTLLRAGKTIATGAGEVLFRESGLSGPVIFDVSRKAKPGDRVLLDLVPQLNRPRLLGYLERWITPQGTIANHALDGLMDPVVGRLMIELARKGWPAPADSVIKSLAALIQRLPFEVMGFDPTNAQLTLGGIALDTLDPHTLAIQRDAQGCALDPGLFGAGELLDVDGPCGGYNLAFAWLSGLRAGFSAAALIAQRPKEAKREASP